MSKLEQGKLKICSSVHTEAARCCRGPVDLQRGPGQLAVAECILSCSITTRTHIGCREHSKNSLSAVQDRTFLHALLAGGSPRKALCGFPGLPPNHTSCSRQCAKTPFASQALYVCRTPMANADLWKCDRLVLHPSAPGFERLFRSSGAGIVHCGNFLLLLGTQISDLASIAEAARVRVILAICAQITCVRLLSQHLLKMQRMFRLSRSLHSCHNRQVYTVRLIEPLQTMRA